jgi:hypothetical protein
VEGVLAGWEGDVLQEEVEGTIWPPPRSCIARPNSISCQFSGENNVDWEEVDKH